MMRRARWCRRRAILLALSLAAVLQLMGMLSAAADAGTPAPWWHLSSASAPSYLRPGDTQDVVFASASNVGDEASNGTVTISDSLPAGLTATAIKLVSSDEHQQGSCEALPALRCSFSGSVQPYVRLEVRITVEVAAALHAGPIQNQVAIDGGEAASTSLTEALKVADEPTPFGIEALKLIPEDQGGAQDLQAGSHPFQLSTVLNFNQTLEPGKGTEPSAPALVKDLHFDLPPGLIGDPQATPQCSDANFATLYVKDTDLCPPQTAVGAALVTLNEPANAGYITATVPLFNLTPAPGKPARFGFEAFNVPVVLDASVRTDGDYNVQVNVSNATTAAQVLGSEVIFWGEPGDPAHDQSRGWQCIVDGVDAIEGESCQAPDPRSTTPLLTLPTSCEGPLTATLSGDSWSGQTLAGSAIVPALTGCGGLPFSPTIDVTGEEHTASTPTGVTVDVGVPQAATLAAGGLAEADVRDTTLTLPAGVELSPSAANGLEGCSEAQIGFLGFNQASETNDFTPAAAECPDGSKVGLVHIRTPLLSHELEGAVYLASPAPNGEAGQNPFGSLIAVYLVAEDPVSGVRVKLAGEGQLDEHSLQLSTTFRNTPQVPFEDLRVELFGGPRAPLSTPPACGAYASSAVFSPWSASGTVGVLSPAGDFQITSGAAGAACPAGALGFAPGFLAQSSSAQAGGFTGFTVELSRADGDQALAGLTMHLPGGVAALLSSVKPCLEAQAQADACPAESLVGEATAVAGLGPEPYVERGGKVYLTGPYRGAPFGLEIVSPAVAGPFDLGTVTVRSKILIDPGNASVTIVSDPLPTQLRGIPLQLKQVIVNVNRPNFEFNPTNCSQMRIDGTISGDRGASAAVSSPFQVAHCAGLPFKPRLTASTKGQASKANGANFDVKVESKGLGQANIAKVRLQLPKALPARLTTLQKACTEGAFSKNPASCPEGSVIGQATIHTPVLSSPLMGPAYLVSHGGAAFPDVEFVLQGEGITLVLDGKTQIKNQITYSKFESAPDAPFTVFETVLPAGPHSALTANLPEKAKFNLCSSSLSMPTEIVAQNGAVLKQTTKIALQGCKRVESAKPKKLTRAQKLALALKACRRAHKYSHARRTACEREARRAAGRKRPARKT